MRLSGSDAHKDIVERWIDVYAVQVNVRRVWRVECVVNAWAGFGFELIGDCQVKCFAWGDGNGWCRIEAGVRSGVGNGSHGCVRVTVAVMRVIDKCGVIVGAEECCIGRCETEES